ncbi:MAG: hypothetical protein EOO01_22380, partial [Chitinophagaceae bacterium]
FLDHDERYAVTKEFLDIYKAGNRDLEYWQDSLHRLKKDAPEEHPLIAKITQLIREKKEFTDLTLDTRKNKTMEEAASLISSGRGKEIMDSIRDAISTYQSQQVALLNRKLSETDDHVTARNANFLLFACITLAFIFIGYTRIRQSAKTILKDHEIQRNLSNELTFQNRQLNEFANITSHNMRSGTANMTALLDLIDHDSTITEYTNIFAMVKKVAANLSESLNELIEVIRVKKNVEIQKEDVVFEHVYSKIAETLQGDILKHQAAISGDFSAAPVVSFSKVYLESILQNLISNAMKYKSPDRLPVISIRSEMVGGHVLLHIKDNGLGIDLPRHGHKIFGLYQMFHKHPEAKGIGLFLTKSQVENLDGKITVASDGQSGTTFSIRFAK